MWGEQFFNRSLFANSELHAILSFIKFIEKVAMLKPQDCVVLIKILANPNIEWSQRQLSRVLSISLAEINGGIKRLNEAGLLRKNEDGAFSPNINAAEEFLISSIKFLFPAKLGEYTRGMPTSIAAPIFHEKIAIGNDPIPVWPDAFGEKKGVALEPLYHTIPKALHENPDQSFYEFLVLIDAIRSGRPRERNLAIALLKEKLQHAK
jgi:hypothetical protein